MSYNWTLTYIENSFCARLIMFLSVCNYFFIILAYLTQQCNTFDKEILKISKISRALT